MSRTEQLLIRALGLNAQPRTVKSAGSRTEEVGAMGLVYGARCVPGARGRGAKRGGDREEVEGGRGGRGGGGGGKKTRMGEGGLMAERVC